VIETVARRQAAGSLTLETWSKRFVLIPIESSGGHLQHVLYTLIYLLCSVWCKVQGLLFA
jgi:hypothetical protein